MEPSTDLSAVARAIDRLTALIAHVNSVNCQDMNVQSRTNGEVVEDPPSIELPVSLASIPDLQVFELNGPQLYVKFRCALCLQEWIVPICHDKLASYRPPKACRWCGSLVWTDPDRAQFRKDQRSKRDAIGADLPSQ
jgi:hypothetical protein